MSFVTNEIHEAMNAFRMILQKHPESADELGKKMMEHLERLSINIERYDNDRIQAKRKLANIESSKSYKLAIKVMHCTNLMDKVLKIRADTNAQREVTDLNTDGNVDENSNTLWPWIQVSEPLRIRIKTLLDNKRIGFESFVLIKSGGMGDVIQLTPVAKALKKMYPDKPVVVMVERFGSVLAQHPHVDLVLEFGNWGFGPQQIIKSLIGVYETIVDVRYISKAYGLLQNTEFGGDHEWYYEHFPQSGFRVGALGQHVSDLMLRSLGLEQFSSSEEVCVTPEPVAAPFFGSNFIVVCNSVDGAVGTLKKWQLDQWNYLIDWMVGKGITPVQLGVSTEPLLSPNVVDFRGKTTPCQAAEVLKRSLGYVGVEGGLFHLSKAVGTKATVIFASTTPCSFAYKDTYVVNKDLCSPCWWTPGWDVGRCSRGFDTCLNLPDWTEVTDAIERMLA